MSILSLRICGGNENGKDYIAIMLAVMLVLSLFACNAESGQLTGDYSWLDDLTINQLKELDAEIHKRIPSNVEDSSDANNESVVLGTWSCNGTLTHVDKYDKTKFQHDHPSIFQFIFLPNGKVQGREICIQCAYVDKSIGGTFDMLSDDKVHIGVYGLCEF